MEYNTPTEYSTRTVSWRAILAGFLVGLLTYFILVSLGVALGGQTLEGAIEGASSAGILGIGTTIWLIVSIVVSLFVGGMIAGRVGGFMPTRVARVEGVVVAALFFFFMLSQLGAAVGLLGRGLGSAAGMVGSAIGDRNAAVQDLMEEGLSDLDFRTPPPLVAQGVGVRLLRGDTEGAKNYLAREAGISPEDAEARLEQIRPRVEQALKDAGATAARIASGVGWALFISMTLGTVAGAIGGGVGASRILKRRDDEPLEEPRIRPRQAA